MHILLYALPKLARKPNLTEYIQVNKIGVPACMHAPCLRDHIDRTANLKSYGLWLLLAT